MVMDAGLPEGELGLFTDLYELTMAQAYWLEDLSGPAVFSLFYRKMPTDRNFMLACGQHHGAQLATRVTFPQEQLRRLSETGLFREDFLEWLSTFRFQGNIRALPEGTPVFPHEPILEVEAPIAQAQVLESLLMNHVNLETLLASKAARVVAAAKGRPVIDFGMRRMHGTDAALRAVRAYGVAGIAGTSNVLGALQYGMPLRGTMAHSFIQAHGDETEAFRLFARLYPGTIVLVDTYDTLAAVDKVIRLIRDEGADIGGVRLDSGDLYELSVETRKRLDAAGLTDLNIVVSGGLNEGKIQDLVSQGAPIDAFGVGTDMGSVADAPTLDLAYKLTEYQGEPRLKNSPGKQLLPGAKEVWRYTDADGRYQSDEVTLKHETRTGEPLLQRMVEEGTLCVPVPSIQQSRDRADTAVRSLPESMRQLEPTTAPWPVTFSEPLLALREQALARLT